MSRTITSSFIEDKVIKMPMLRLLHVPNFDEIVKRLFHSKIAQVNYSHEKKPMDSIVR